MKRLVLLGTLVIFLSLNLFHLLLMPRPVFAEEVTLRITNAVVPAKALPGTSFTVTISIEWSGFQNLRSGRGPGGNTISPPPSPPYGLWVTICEGTESHCDSPLWQNTDMTSANSGSKTYSIQLTAPGSSRPLRLTVSLALSLKWGTSTLNFIRDHRTFNVNVTDKVAVTVWIKPGKVSVPISIDGNTMYTDSAGRALFQVTLTGSHIIQVPSEFSTGLGTRIVFVKWGDGQTSNSRTLTASDDIAFTAEYKTQHLLTVNSPVGNPQGSGWYDEGSSPTFSVTSPWAVEGVMGMLGGKHIFERWSGDLAATTTSASVKIDGPKTVTAEWRTDNTAPYLVLGVIGAALIVALVLLLRRRPTKHVAESQREAQ